MTNGHLMENLPVHKELKKNNLNQYLGKKNELKVMRCLYIKKDETIKLRYIRTFLPLFNMTAEWSVHNLLTPGQLQLLTGTLKVGCLLGIITVCKEMASSSWKARLLC